jgi:hypothetical protein
MPDRWKKALAACCFAALMIGARPLGEDWVTVPDPHGDFVSQNCANWSNEDWGVSLADGELRIARADPPAADTHAALGPGMLTGIDHGEFGGALGWKSRSGDYVQLVDENIHALVPVAGGVLAFGGLDHLGYRSGSIYRVALEHGKPVAQQTAKLPASPDVVATGPDGSIVALTLEGVYRVSPKGEATRIAALDTRDLYPGSLAMSEDGTLYAGMRHHVVSLKPDGNSYAATWWAPRACAAYRRDVENGPCICVAQP